MTKFVREPELDELQTVVPFSVLLLLLLAAISGASAAIAILPGWLPGLNESLAGSAPQAFWFLSRSSAGIAFVLIWLSMLLGLAITNKFARVWPGGPVAYDLHQYFSLLGLVFAVFHALILMGDQYIHYSLRDVLIPFASSSYRPLWIGLGQTGLYLTAIITFSFYVRRQITPKLWRKIHYLSFLGYGLTLLHGIFSGTDSTILWVNRFYLGSAGFLLFFLIYRLLLGFIRGKPRVKPSAT